MAVTAERAVDEQTAVVMIDWLRQLLLVSAAVVKVLVSSANVIMADWPLFC